MTPRQNELYEFMLPFCHQAIQPSVDEMAVGIGSHRSNVSRMIHQLKAAGLVVKLPGNVRCYRAVPADPFRDISDQRLADALRERGYTVEAFKHVPRHPDSGWAMNPRISL